MSTDGQGFFDRLVRLSAWRGDRRRAGLLGAALLAALTG
jgi:hypothetical protein